MITKTLGKAEIEGKYLNSIKRTHIMPIMPTGDIIQYTYTQYMIHLQM